MDIFLDFQELRKELTKYVSQDKTETALKLYRQCGSVTKATYVLRDPSKKGLYNWILNEGTVKSVGKELLLVNTAEHPRNPPLEVKMEAIHRCFGLGESVKSVFEEIGYIRAAFIAGRKDIFREEQPHG